MRGELTDDERRDIDAQLSGEPIEPVLSLWEELSRIGGGMPVLEPDHVRVILMALRRQRGVETKST
jgi:hypothetical protein